MKLYRKFIFIYLFSISIYTFSQSNDQIEILYSERVFWEIKDSSKYSKEQLISLKNTMLEKRFFNLKANRTESLYNSVPKINNSQSNSFHNSFHSSENYIYKNLDDNFYIIEETYPKLFFIKDYLQNLNWSINKETKSYKDYIIKSAYCEFNGYKILAWYNEDISIPTGPKYLGGLPGIILIVEMEHIKTGEKTQILAEKISFSNTNKIIKPNNFKENKAISKEKYDEILKKHIQKENVFFNISVDK